MTDQVTPEELEFDSEAVVEHSDTLPPPEGSHGWLEQFEALASSSLDELEKVVSAGLEPAENAILIAISAKLISLAKVHDPQAVSKLLELV